MTPLFITGIGTDIGKTVVAAILTQALEASYWKPVQAGFEHGTDSQWVSERISRPQGRILPETYKLALPASPHIAARQENISIDLDRIAADYRQFSRDPSSPGNVSSPGNSSSPGNATSPGNSSGPRNSSSPGNSSGPGGPPGFLVIEGAGGLFVPLNDQSFVIDLVKQIDAPVILVSRNYLGSINHSLMTAALCKAHHIPVAGWVFNDQYLHYEEEIVRWTGIPAIASIPHHAHPDAEFVSDQAARIRIPLLQHLKPWLV